MEEPTFEEILNKKTKRIRLLKYHDMREIDIFDGEALINNNHVFSLTQSDILTYNQINTISSIYALEYLLPILRVIYNNGYETIELAIEQTDEDSKLLRISPVIEGVSETIKLAAHKWYLAGRFAPDGVLDQYSCFSELRKMPTELLDKYLEWIPQILKERAVPIKGGLNIL